MSPTLVRCASNRRKPLLGRYARQFPARRLRSGAAVKSYEDFVAWLQEQAGPSGLSTDELPIPGRSTVLWRR
jgi:hypothetical protein